MKRITTLVIALLFVFSLAFALVACDGGECAHVWDEGSVTKEPTCTEDGSKSFTCTLCKETKLETLAKLEHTYVNGACSCGATDPDYKDTEVNSEEWRDIFSSARSYTMNQSMGESVASILFTENIRYQSSAQYGSILVKDGDKYYEYKRTGEDWSKEEIGADDFARSDTYAHMLITYADDYASFTYDAASKTYKCASLDKTDVLGATLTDIEVQIENGKILKVTFKVSVSQNEKTDVVIDKINETTITLPEVCEHVWDNGEVTKAATCKAEGEKTFTCTLCEDTKTEPIAKLSHTYVNGTCSCGAVDPDYVPPVINEVADADEWNAVLGGAYLNNVTYKSTETNGDDVEIIIVKEYNGVLYITEIEGDDTDSCYFVTKDGAGYIVYEEDGEFVGEEADEYFYTDYSYIGGLAEYFLDEFEKFSYDADKKCYHADDLHGSIVDVYIENGKLVKFTVVDDYANITYEFDAYGNSLVEAPDFTPLVSNGLIENADEWNEYVRADKYANISYTMLQYINGMQTIITVSEDESWFCQVQADGQQSNVLYLHKDGDKYYQITKSGDEFIVSDSSEDVWNTLKFNSICTLILNQFDKFIYNDDMGAYVSDGTVQDDTMIAVMFDDKYISSVLMQNATKTQIIEIVEIGGVSVTPPDYESGGSGDNGDNGGNGGNGSGSVSTSKLQNADEWKAALGGEQFENYTLNAEMRYVQNGTSTVMLTLSGKYADGKSEETNSFPIGPNEYEEETSYLYRDDGVWYRVTYEEDEEVWYSYELFDYEPSYDYQWIYESFGELYDSFTYEENGQLYYAMNIDVEMNGEIIVCNVIFQFSEGKLLYMYIEEMQSSGAIIVYEYTFSDYGTTEVVIPEHTAAN